MKQSAKPTPRLQVEPRLQKCHSVQLLSAEFRNLSVLLSSPVSLKEGASGIAADGPTPRTLVQQSMTVFVHVQDTALLRITKELSVCHTCEVANTALDRLVHD